MYKKHEHVHFMGIGGIGMSGIAEILRMRGYTVSGCDLGPVHKTITHLQELGCTIQQGHDVAHIHEADVLVYSSAVRREDREVQAALEKGIPVIPRALMLGELMRTKYSVAVSGSHGKTTTTSLISHIMIEAERQPTVIIGGVLKNIANNARFGGGEVLIAEADESDRSLLYLTPTMAVVTNINAEHLDTYADLEDVQQTFKGFLARLPFYGKAFVCIDDPHVRDILPLPHVYTKKYGVSPDADIMACNIRLEATYSTFDVIVLQPRTYPSRRNLSVAPQDERGFVCARGEELHSSVSNHSGASTVHKEPHLLGSVKLNIPGHHNILNSLAAIGVCLEFDIPFAMIAAALSTFHGVERRFEYKGICKGAEVFDDYGHHPVEIESTLHVAKMRVKKGLHIAFQPHRFTRTKKLWDDFVDVFARGQDRGYTINTLYITDIYPASEDPIQGITSDRLVQAIKAANPGLNVIYVASYDAIIKSLAYIVQEGDMVLTLGAGKMNQIAEMLVEKPENSN